MDRKGLVCLKIKCSVEIKGGLEPGYAKPLTAALLGKIAAGDPALALSLHDCGFRDGNFVVKKFSHSQVSGLVWDGRRFVQGGPAYFCLGWSGDVVAAFVSAAEKDPVLDVGGTQVVVQKVEALPPGGSVYRCLSPVVAKSKDGYIAEYGEAFLESLRVNAVKKLRLLTGEPVREEALDVVFPRGARLKRIRWGAAVVPGFQGYVRIDADPEHASLLGEVGLGCMTSCGFGFLEPVPAWMGVL